MNQIERNIVASFNLAKKDLMMLQQDVVMLTQNQHKTVKIIENMKKELAALKAKLAKTKAQKKTVVVRTVKTVKSARKKTVFVASKTGAKFHKENCPFAQNIKPKMKIKFASKTKALNEGYKPCSCIK